MRRGEQRGEAMQETNRIETASTAELETETESNKFDRPLVSVHCRSPERQPCVASEFRMKGAIIL